MQEISISLITAISSLVMAILITFLAFLTIRKLQGSDLFWVVILFFLTSISLIVHASVEILAIGEVLYAGTAVITTLLFATSLLFFQRFLKKVGVVE